MSGFAAAAKPAERLARPAVEAAVRTWLTLLVFSAVLARAVPEFAAGKTWLHLDGYTYHFAAPGANNLLFGLGFTHYDTTYGRVIPAWGADVFRDFGCKPSAYVGRSWTIPLERVAGGLTAAVMYHRNFG